MKPNIKMFKIAMNNVLKNKRRSTLNMLTIALNVLILLYGIGMLVGQFNSMFERMIDLQAGHIKIFNKEYYAEKQTLPLDINIENPEQVILDIQGAPHFRAAAARIAHMGFISDTKKKMPVAIYGIDMEREKKILSIYDKIDGAPLAKTGAQVVVGKKLAEILGVKTGGSMLLFSQTLYNANNLTDVSVPGIFNAGFDMMEKGAVYIPLEFARDFFDMKGKATEIIIRLDRTEDVSAAKKYISGVLAAKYPQLVAMDWKEINPELMETARVKYSSFVMFLVILLFLAVFIIMNTLTMTVFERIPEIGTLRAIGFQKEEIMSLFMTEGIILSVLGVLLGYILAAPVIYYLNVHGIVLDPKLISTYNIPMSNVLKSINTFQDWIIAGIVCIVAGTVGAYFPAIRASKINIVVALKKGVR